MFKPDSSGDNLTIHFYWTPDCGAQHVTTNPNLPNLTHCPDGLTGWADNHRACGCVTCHPEQATAEDPD